MRASIFVVLLAAITMFACEDPGTSSNEDTDNEPIFEEVEINFFTVDKGPNSVIAKSEYTIRSEFEYTSLFGRSSNGFNFTSEMMVAVFKGEVSLSEHEYTVTRILERENDILVTMTFESCIECNTSTSAPYHIVGLDRTNKRFVFEEVTNN